MKKTITLSLIMATLFGQNAFAQNVGVGTPTPATKLNVVQVADVTGIEVDHAGATGNSIVAFPQNAANTSSAVWILNNSGGRGLNVAMTNAASTSRGILVTQEAANDGMLIQHNNAIGAGQWIDLTDATNNFSGIQLDHAGTGFGQHIDMTNTGATSVGLLVTQAGTDALSRGVSIGLTNASQGLAVFQSGTGMGIYSSSGGDGLISFASGVAGNAVYGSSTGTGGVGGYFNVNNTAANLNSLGLLVQYNGTGVSGAGGGNAAEIQHNGTNGNAVEVFVGSPGAAPGPANTTNEYVALAISHMGTGSSAVSNKSALQATVYGNDPTIFATTNGTGARDGVVSVANPNGFNDPRAVLGYSYEAANYDFGIGVEGIGGFYGVHGIKNGINEVYTFAVYGSGDYGGTGAKYFSIDHPLDPENKILNHYSIESNEVTNMYRGIVKLDANGQAEVALPTYFDAANIEPSYQLTAIGTPTQPYVLTEVANNKFMVAGAPNTKVSWTVYAKRNDQTIQYFSNSGKHYDQEEVEKPARMKGKYYTPEAFGQPASKGIHYRADNTKYLEQSKNPNKNDYMETPKTDKFKDIQPTTTKGKGIPNPKVEKETAYREK